MWEAKLAVACGSWQVGVRFDSAATAARFGAEFADVLITDDGLPAAVGVRTRDDLGSTLFHGHVPLARVHGDAALWEAMAWFFAGLAHARRGVVDVADVRVVLGTEAAVLLACPRPELIGAHAWRRAGLVELPLLAVAVTEDGIVLPSPLPRHLGVTERWAGAAVPVAALVARAATGELRDETVERLSGSFHGVQAQALLANLRRDRAVRTGGDRQRLIRHVLAALAS